MMPSLIFLGSKKILLLEKIPKVLHRVPPCKHEDVTGFLMRVAARNHLPGPAKLQTLLTGTPNRPITVNDLGGLAEMCRCTRDEINLLSGYEWRISGEDRAWRVGGQWVTKPVFISLRRPKVCPACLCTENYLRGEWSLGFLFACAIHETRLLEECPGCHRRLPWMRRNPRMCACGYDLAQASPMKASEYEVALARLLAYQISGDAGYLAGIPLDCVIAERLAGLSVDGTCKTVWFLGHCLSEISQCSSGHGRKKPSADSIGPMVERAFCMLQDWPDAIGNWLRRTVQSGLSPGFSAAEYEFLLAPALNYFRSSVDTAELNFLATAFEQHVRQLWLIMGRHHPKCEFERQLELKF